MKKLVALFVFGAVLMAGLPGQAFIPPTCPPEGSGSSDRNGSLPLTYARSFSSKPMLSNAANEPAEVRNEPAEVRIVSTEFRFAPATVLATAGRAVTLVLDNSTAETEHGLFVPAVGFRLQVKAGEIARKNTVFVKPGKYEFICDLPGHHDAGMKGTLIVVDR